MPSPLTPPGVESTSTTLAPSATSTATSSAHHNSLIPLFPALFVPLFVLFVSLLLLVCYYRRRRSPPSAPSTSAKFAWLSTLARRPKTAGYTPAPAKPTDPRSPPTEKSALLKGFMAQHHRHSSSLTSLPRHSVEDEVDDDLVDLVQQNQSLLQRLTLGLGWVSPVERRTSGNMVEKTAGLGLSVATAAAGTKDAEHARDVTGATGQTNASSSGQPTMSPTSAGYEPVLTNDELFYHPPETGSSGAFNTDTTTSGQSRSTGSRPGRPSSGSAPGAFPWGSRGAAGGAGKQGKDEQEDDHGDMGEFGNRRGWAASLLRFPAPPGWRNSVVSSEASFHTAAEDSLPRSPIPAVGAAQARPHTPSHGHPLSRTEENYAHAPLSAFGSAPNTPSGSPPKITSPLLPASHSPSPARNRRNLDARPPRSGSPLQREQASVPKRQSGLHEEIDVASPILPSTPSGFTLEAGEAETSDSHHTLGPKLTLPLFINSPSSASATSPTGQEERSYTGEPLVQRTKSGSGWQMRKSSYGDFGEPLRNVSSRNAPNLSRQATMVSEAASVHSSAHGSSGKSSGSHGSGRDIDLTRALRGRRSQGMLLRASTIGKPKV